MRDDPDAAGAAETNSNSSAKPWRPPFSSSTTRFSRISTRSRAVELVVEEVQQPVHSYK